MSRHRALKLSLLTLLVATATAGCGNGGGTSQQRLAIDERRGSVGGVELGASKGDVRARFGDYGDRLRAYPIEPLEMDEDERSGGPWSVATGPHHLGPGGLKGEQVTLRYRGVSFFVRKDRVFGFMVTSDEGKTRRGVAVGDDLSAAKNAYPELRCEPQSESDTTAPQKANCSGRVPGGRYIYFGGDPIESVTVMERSFESYAY